MKVPTRLLRCEWPPNPGIQGGNPHFDAILESVKRNGIQEALTIKLDWTVIDGAHRLSAARLLGIDRVEVRVWTGVEFVE